MHICNKTRPCLFKLRCMHSECDCHNAYNPHQSPKCYLQKLVQYADVLVCWFVSLICKAIWFNFFLSFRVFFFFFYFFLFFSFFEQLLFMFKHWGTQTLFPQSLTTLISSSENLKLNLLINKCCTMSGATASRPVYKAELNPVPKPTATRQGKASISPARIVSPAVSLLQLATVQSSPNINPFQRRQKISRHRLTGSPLSPRPTQAHALPTARPTIGLCRTHTHRSGDGQTDFANLPAEVIFADTVFC